MTGVNGLDSERISEHKYTYDAEDNVTKVETKESKTQTAYDTLVSYAYDNMNNLTSETRGNVTTTYTYNLGNLVTNMTNKKGSGILSKYDYTYNYDGNVATKTDSEYVTTYKYDPMNRLIYEKTPNGRYEYEYDAAGNRVSLDCVSYPYEDYNISYVYDKNNRLIEENKTYPGNDEMYVMNYYYDNNGNLRTKTTGREDLYGPRDSYLGIYTKSELPRYVDTEYFTYNVFNQLTKYSSKGTSATYTYLPNGYRNSKTVDGTVTNFVWDGDNIALEADSSYNTTNILFRGRNLIRDSKGKTMSMTITAMLQVFSMITEQL
ncbi:MAG: hypothetical protein Q4D26_12720 [Clostridia bacterium]|nr:hypothetical protein [Clostridia bacterium]